MRYMDLGQGGDDSRELGLVPALAPILCATLLYAVSWLTGCSSTAASSRKGTGPASAREIARLSPEDANDKLVPALSGRKLTIEKMAQSAATSLQFSNEEYGIAFDAPKGYVLKEGELSTMDRGLGYPGPIPMHFTDHDNGVRLATVEAPIGVHMGTNFVNEFFTVSALYETTPEACGQFDIAAESRGVALTRTIDRITFQGFRENAAASMHQYRGVYLHGYANETCYEIGYGVATLGDGAGRNVRHVDAEKLLNNLERILDTVRISPPDFEKFTPAEQGSN